MTLRRPALIFIATLTVLIAAFYLNQYTITILAILSHSHFSSIFQNLPARYSLVYHTSSLQTLSQSVSFPTPVTFPRSTSTKMTGTTKKGQVYFLSHGGPPTMYETESEPYKAWQRYGTMVEDSKPKGLIVISAHWENPDESDTILINEDSTNPLVYDFYGFPAKYYKEKFESQGSPEMVIKIKDSLESAGLNVQMTKRGLDHGVWVPFKVAFKDAKTDIPIVQISLPGDSNPVSCAKLGRAVAVLRNQGYGIMATGQVVHNLRDFRLAKYGGVPSSILSVYGSSKGHYGKIFMEAVKTAVHSSKPLESSLTLFRHPSYKQAHPTPEHLLPLIVATGAVEEGDIVDEIYAESDGALGWGMWRWKAVQ